MPTFPSGLALLDSFKRATEDPLSNGGKWAVLFNGTTIGKVGAAEAYTGKSTYAAGEDNAYYNVGTYANPGVAAVLSKIPTSEEREAFLYCCISEPGNINLSYYRLRIKRVGAEKFDCFLERVDKGSHNNSAEKKAVTIKAGYKLGLTAIEGVVTFWLDTGAGWEVLFEMADATYTTGYVGIGAHGKDEPGFQNFEAVAASSHSHTLTIAQPQTPTAAKAVERTLVVAQPQTPTVQLPHEHILTLTEAPSVAMTRSLARTLKATQGQSPALNEVSSANHFAMLL